MTHEKQLMKFTKWYELYIRARKVTLAKENERKGNWRKSDPRGIRTHILCYRGRCPRPVRLYVPS